MKLPLLFHFTPRVGTGPTVMLASGDWRIESNHQDAELRIALGSDLFPLQDKISLEKDSPITIAINKLGSEKTITIYAIKE